MTAVLIFVRNLVLAAIMAWFGVEFAPDADTSDEPQSPTTGAARF